MRRTLWFIGMLVIGVSLAACGASDASTSESGGALTAESDHVAAMADLRKSEEICAEHVADGEVLSGWSSPISVGDLRSIADASGATVPVRWRESPDDHLLYDCAFEKVTGIEDARQLLVDEHGLSSEPMEPPESLSHTSPNTFD